MTDQTRTEVTKRIKLALKRRSGKDWSVTGGRGTASGWLNIAAPDNRCTSHSRLKAGAVTDRPEDYESVDTGEPGGYMTHADCQLLADLLGLARPVHFQGESIPGSGAYWNEYIDRAEGRTPTKCGEPYWD